VPCKGFVTTAYVSEFPSASVAVNVREAEVPVLVVTDLSAATGAVLAAVPVPDSDRVVGEVDALLVIVRDPVSAPAAVGV